MSGDAYRTVPATVMREILLLGGFAFEQGEGKLDDALTEIDGRLEAWARAGLGRREDASEGWRYDPFEVINHYRWLGLNGADDYFERRCAANARRLTGEWMTNDGPRRFSMRLSRTFNLAAVPSGTNLRLTLPLPMPESDPDLLDMRVSPSTSASLMLGPGRLTAKLDRGELTRLELSAEVGFRSKPFHRSESGPDAPLSADERARYLNPTEGLIRVTPAVRDLAHDLVGASVDPVDAADAFYDHLLDAFACGAIHYDQLAADRPLDWVLQRRWYDCQLGSALHVALCRAVGVPARLISGHLLYRLAPSNHFWAEVWAADRGWVPYDLMGWGLSLGGRSEAWRRRFAGLLDHRMVTQRLPQLFTGPMSVRFPPAWHMLQTHGGDGIDIAFTRLSGDLIYRDRIERLGVEDVA